MNPFVSTLEPAKNYFYRSLVVTSSFGIQEKRYRSMQEHIRRAHPEHYISKLPATEESFQLMITTPPSEKPAPPQPATVNANGMLHFQNTWSAY